MPPEQPRIKTGYPCVIWYKKYTVLKNHKVFYILENYNADSHKERIDACGKRKDKDC